MKVRVGRLEDLEAVVQLERGAMEAPHWGAESYREALAGAGALPRRVFVGELDGIVVGFAVGMVGAGEGEIENVVVESGVRRAGLGRGLCEAVVAWCEGEGAAGVGLEVRASSAGVIALYAGLGFCVVGRRKGYYREPMDDAVVMRLRLRTC